MNKYLVQVPITGYAEIEVEAENKEEAVSRAMQNVTFDDVAEWEVHREVCKGNVCYALLGRVDVEEVEEN